MNCPEQTEVFSRVVGYYRPVQMWNAGKKAEFKRRKTYVIDFGALAPAAGDVPSPAGRGVG